MDLPKMVYVQGGEGEEFQDRDPGETQELIDTAPVELTDDNLMEMSASKPVLDNEEDYIEGAPENKLTDNMAKGFQLFKTFYLFLDWILLWYRH